MYSVILLCIIFLIETTTKAKHLNFKIYLLLYFLNYIKMYIWQRFFLVCLETFAELYVGTITIFFKLNLTKLCTFRKYEG